MKINSLLLVITLFFTTHLFGDFDPNHYRRYVTIISISKYSDKTYLTLSDGLEIFFEKSFLNRDIAFGTEFFISYGLRKTYFEENYKFEFNTLNNSCGYTKGGLSVSTSLPTVKELHRVHVKKKKRTSYGKYINIRAFRWF